MFWLSPYQLWIWFLAPAFLTCFGSRKPLDVLHWLNSNLVSIPNVAPLPTGHLVRMALSGLVQGLPHLRTGLKQPHLALGKRTQEIRNTTYIGETRMWSSSAPSGPQGENHLCSIWEQQPHFWLLATPSPPLGTQIHMLRGARLLDEWWKPTVWDAQYTPHGEGSSLLGSQFCMETTGLRPLHRQYLLALCRWADSTFSPTDIHVTRAMTLMWVQASALGSQNQSWEDPGVKPRTVTTPGCA